jgi:hypothetical protein
MKLQQGFWPLSINARATCILGLTGLTLFWLFLAISQVLSLADNTEPIQWAGLRLALIAFVGLWLPAGLAGQGRWTLLPTVFLLSLTIYCGFEIYPTSDVWRYPIRLAMQLLQAGILLLWAVHCARQRVATPSE